MIIVSLFWNDSLYLLFYFMSGHNEDDKHRMIYFVVYMGDSPSLFFLKPYSPGNLPTRSYSFSMSHVPFAYLSCFIIIIIKSNRMHSMTSLMYDNWVFVPKVTGRLKGPHGRWHGRQNRPVQAQTQAGALALRISKCELWVICLKSENNTFSDEEKTYVFLECFRIPDICNSGLKSDQFFLPMYQNHWAINP